MQVNDKGAIEPTASVAVNYADRSIAALTAGQAAGTSAILSPHSRGTRRALMIVPPSDCVLTIASGAETGVPLFGNLPNRVSGSDCPANELFVSGLAEGDALTIWEG
ncbi:hypothetical protein [Stakelama pacifica]|uniref:Uncharacterized protein n=1 Tax=Stakelama pacifica TaxID=517720 RepID=A0A4R6FMY7_9SPHN|nr:hypothetical protein [Stakelama pacifica]TDN82961.1 hypothetical protein EV664_105159 [Stakelama pacifica]GGO95075.1 hypothetical protein GCM10011329_18400 [Stakelama pacifica]